MFFVSSDTDWFDGEMSNRLTIKSTHWPTHIVVLCLIWIYRNIVKLVLMITRSSVK